MGQVVMFCTLCIALRSVHSAHTALCGLQHADMPFALSMFDCTPCYSPCILHFTRCVLFKAFFDFAGTQADQKWLTTAEKHCFHGGGGGGHRWNASFLSHFSSP